MDNKEKVKIDYKVLDEVTKEFENDPKLVIPTIDIGECETKYESYKLIIPKRESNI